VPEADLASTLTKRAAKNAKTTLIATWKKYWVTYLGMGSVIAPDHVRHAEHSGTSVKRDDAQQQGKRPR
jgi:hypothetical protein